MSKVLLTRGCCTLKILMKHNVSVGCVDSNYATDLDKKRSLRGYVFMLYGNVLVGDQLFKQLLLCPIQKQSIWV